MVIGREKRHFFEEFERVRSPQGFAGTRANTGSARKNAQLHKQSGIGIGGAGGSRTRVRKHSTVSSTCVVWSTGFNLGCAGRQAQNRRVTFDLTSNQVTRKEAIPSK